MATSAIDRHGIEATWNVIKPYVRVTPVVEVDGADFGLDTAVLYFKLEQLQHSGSFKVRGAFANLLMRTLPDAGVVAASGGSHGVAVAYAAQRLGVRAKIFVPTTTAACFGARPSSANYLGGDEFERATPETASRMT